MKNSLLKMTFSLLAIGLLFPAKSYAAPEKWYAYWSLGLADHNHPGDWDADFRFFESVPGANRTQLSLDMFGFYFPLSSERNDSLGFVINGTADSVTFANGDVYQLNLYLYGLSYMMFMGQEIGDGFFIRGDAGIAKGIQTVSGQFGDRAASSESGTGFLFGAGYAHPLSANARLLFGINSVSRKIEDETFGATEFTIGILW